VTLFAALLIGVGMFIGNSRSDLSSAAQNDVSASKPISIAPPAPASAVMDASSSANSPLQLKNASGIQLPNSVKATPARAEKNLIARKVEPPVSVDEEHKATPLLLQRLQATRTALNSARKGSIGIQLFFTDNIRPERMEGFLTRAQKLGKLQEIYLLTININGKEGYRVLYGIYPDSASANASLENLPQRYKDAFAPAMFTLPSVTAP
jgi:septal ring-binding cell division protein DamX